MDIIIVYLAAITVPPTLLMLADAYVACKTSQGKSKVEGIYGFRRSVLALSIILIIGVATLHVLVNGKIERADAIVNNVLSILAGLASAAAGFYFGGKFAERSEKTDKPTVQKSSADDDMRAS